VQGLKIKIISRKYECVVFLNTLSSHADERDHIGRSY
jgi:hypothetical protein